MEKPLYPSKYMRITQGYNEGTHLGSFAIDEAGNDPEISTMFAPYTGVIKKIYVEDANEIWFESSNEVEYPDGTVDYMTILFAHDNDIKDLYIGKEIKKGEILYKEGSKGHATGNHCHIECGRGKFTNEGWYENSDGNWVINNGKSPEECLWIDDTINIIDNHNYNFKKIFVDDLVNSEDMNINDDIKEDNKDVSIEKQAILTFKCVNDGLYAIKLKKGQTLYLKE